MASWILVPCLVSLRNEFNELAPDRDKASDGSIGDTSHAASSSDHNPDETGNTPYEDADSKNEVHAIDVDDDLRKPGWSMTRALEIIITRHREGRDNRLQNVIYNRRIWSASWGWTARSYTGANAHTEHAHFSARYTTSQESDTRPWGLLEEDDVTKSEFTAWMTEWAKSSVGKQALAVAVLTYSPGADANGHVKPGGVPNYGTNNKEMPTTSPAWALGRASIGSVVGYQIRDRVDRVQATLDQLAKDEQLTALDAIGDPAQSAEETAAALRAALGDRAAEVGRLLAS
jgi:hypothetical protein